jgi:hypothetical protein
MSISDGDNGTGVPLWSLKQEIVKLHLLRGEEKYGEMKSISLI